MTTTAASKQALGRYGESVAARHLVQVQGMALIDRNWRCGRGEIDLVLRDGAVLVICEVKTRTGVGCGTPHEAVDDTKRDRLQDLARLWMQAHDVSCDDVRVDLVAVLAARRGPAVIDHVRGIG
jgi:putative endonuclease